MVKKDNKSDLRSSKIFLTQIGREAAKMISNIFLDWGNLISEGLSEDEKTIALDISHKLYENAFNYYCKLEDRR